jgi:hypothetical protein
VFSVCKAIEVDEEQRAATGNSSEDKSMVDFLGDLVREFVESKGIQPPVLFSCFASLFNFISRVNFGIGCTYL